MTSNEPEGSPPVSVGRYQLKALTTAGTLGELWQARVASGPESGRLVRLRRISRIPPLPAGAVDRISKVGFSALELRHPRVAAMLDVLVLDSEIAVVSEHIDGTLLQSLLRPSDGKRQAVPVPVATRVAADALQALEDARGGWAELFPDLETEEDRVFASNFFGALVPDNLLIASFGETMLLEAGLSGTALATPPFSNHPDYVAYRAPEQLSPGGGDVDERADVFTVGVLLWELIAGRSLFGPAFLPRPQAASNVKARHPTDALQASSARHKVLTSPISRLDALPLLRGKVTKEMADFVARCLNRDRAARFLTLREAMGALRGVAPVGSHGAVTDFLTSLMKPAAELDGATATALESNRPTPAPPEPTQDTAPPATRRRLGADEPNVEAPTARGEAAEAPAISEVTLPPEAAEPAGAALVEDLDADLIDDPGPSEDIAPTAFSVTAVAVVAPPPPRGLIATERALVSFPGPSSSPLAEPEATEAAVVRPLGFDDTPDAGPSTVANRRDLRKIVVGVMCVAVALGLVGVARALLGHRDNATTTSEAPRPTRAHETAPAATPSAPSEPAPSPAGDVPSANAPAALPSEPAPPPAAPSGALPESTPPQPSAVVAPTLSPAAVAAPALHNDVENVPKKSEKKHVFRPRGI